MLGLVLVLEDLGELECPQVTIFSHDRDRNLLNLKIFEHEDEPEHEYDLGA